MQENSRNLGQISMTVSAKIGIQNIDTYIDKKRSIPTSLLSRTMISYLLFRVRVFAPLAAVSTFVLFLGHLRSSDKTTY